MTHGLKTYTLSGRRVRRETWEPRVLGTGWARSEEARAGRDEIDVIHLEVDDLGRVRFGELEVKVPENGVHVKVAVDRLNFFLVQVAEGASFLGDWCPRRIRRRDIDFHSRIIEEAVRD